VTQSIAAMSAAPLCTIAMLAAWVPVTLTSAKKRPAWLAGATNALNAFMPECDLRPFTAHMVPRISAMPPASRCSPTIMRLA